MSGITLVMAFVLSSQSFSLAKKHKGDEEIDYGKETSSSVEISPTLKMMTPKTASVSSVTPERTDQSTDGKAADGGDESAKKSDEKTSLKSGSTESSVPSEAGPDSAPVAPTKKAAKGDVLKGSAEVTRSNEDNQLRAWRAAQLYKQGVACLGLRNFKFAAEYFKQSGDLFETTFGYEKALAESRYAEAQARRLLGQTQQASKLYQAAIDLFQEYDPLSPYLKGAMDTLKNISPNLKAGLAKSEFRFQALKLNNRVVSIDRNVILKGRVTDDGQARLMAEKALLDLGSDYVKKTIHKAFVRMTCLETTDIGSNYNNADDRWLPLIANGKTVALTASQDGINPIITLKLNERLVNTSVDLPGLAGSKRTVLLLTDGHSVIAIDPGTEDIWKLVPSFDKKGAHTSSWQHLVHRKGLHFTDNEKN
jgi:tetratricopeptide (TPR) repeat protein